MKTSEKRVTSSDKHGDKVAKEGVTSPEKEECKGEAFLRKGSLTIIK